MSRRVVTLIPVRLESKRLPGKALLEVDGLPIIVHTAKRASLSKLSSETYVCTDNEEIIEVCKKHNISVLKTDREFNNGTERIASIADKFHDCLIVDVQGDEPLIKPDHIDKVIKCHINHEKKPDIIIPTINVPYDSGENIIKVISSNSNRIMILTRANLPYRFKDRVTMVAKHVSVITFEYKALIAYSKLKQSYLERIEDIELLRAIENDMNVYSFNLEGQSFSVDVNDDYLKAQIAMKNDPIRNLY